MRISIELPAQVLIKALLALSTTASASLARAIPAFPGADGASASAIGGRGGVVYHVTRLDGEIDGDRDAVGTLAYGLDDDNFTVDGVVRPRTIVFDVGGTIWLGRRGEDVGWDTRDSLSVGSHLTIAGQTAPGGINILGGGLSVDGDNVIIRNVVIAPGYGVRSVNPTTGYADRYTYDALDISGRNVLIDHVTAVFATDETISVNERAQDVTVQFSNISQGQNFPQADAEATAVVYTGHALGSLIQGGHGAKISFHHNLYAQQKGRLPRVGTELPEGRPPRARGSPSSAPATTSGTTSSTTGSGRRAPAPGGSPARTTSSATSTSRAPAARSMSAEGTTP